MAILVILRDWALIIGVAALSVRIHHWAAYLLAVWVIGFFQFALGEAMLHEGAHYNLFTRRSWNHFFEIFYGLPFFRTVVQYQPEHRIHHARLGGEDDELLNDYRRQGLFDPGVNVTWVWLIKPILGFGAYYASILTLKPWKDGAKIIAFWAVVVSLFYYFGMLRLLALYWIVPLLWSNYAFVYWSEIENHYNTRSGTRTNISPIYNFVTHNGGYHAVHHKYPTIPWFNLPRAHAIYFPEADDLSRGFIDTYRQLRRNVTGASIPAFVRAVAAQQRMESTS